MTTNVVELVKSYLTSALVTQLSTALDETEPRVNKALYKAVVLVLSSTLKRLSDGFAPEVLLLAVRAADTAEVLRQLSYPATEGATLLLDLVGAPHQHLEQEVCLGTGIRPATAGPLLHVAATAVAGVLGQESREGNPTPVEFASWLGTQRGVIDSALIRIAIETAFASRPAPASQPLKEPLTEVPHAPKTPLATAEAPGPPAGRSAPDLSPGLPAWLRWQWGLLLLAALGLGYFLGTAWLK